MPIRPFIKKAILYTLLTPIITNIILFIFIFLISTCVLIDLINDSISLCDSQNLTLAEYFYNLHTSLSTFFSSNTLFSCVSLEAFQENDVVEEPEVFEPLHKF